MISLSSILNRPSSSSLSIMGELPFSLTTTDWSEFYSLLFVPSLITWGVSSLLAINKSSTFKPDFSSSLIFCAASKSTPELIGWASFLLWKKSCDWLCLFELLSVDLLDLGIWSSSSSSSKPSMCWCFLFLSLICSLMIISSSGESSAFPIDWSSSL